MSITETVPFNFDELYSSLQTKFQEKGYDSLYEGSNTAQLITAMSYLISMLNINTAVNVNETILSLANKRRNILQDARILGYEISHMQSYVYKLVLEFNTEGTHIIPKYTKFTSGDNTYYYMDGDMTPVVVGTGETKTIEIEVKEGVLKTFSTDPDLLSTVISTVTENDIEITQYYVDVPIKDIENDGLEVFLTYYDEFGTLHENELWTKTERFLIDKDTTLDKNYVRLDDIDYRMPRIYFKLSGVGEGVRLGTIVEINALISKGEEGNMESLPTTTEECNVLSYELVIQGTSEESTSSIKENAPLFYNSANRVVTKSDYIAFCTRQSTVDVAEIWGGDDEYPKAPGHIWFSFVPSSINRSVLPIDNYNMAYAMQNSEDLTNWFIEDEEIQSTQYNDNNELINPGIWDFIDDYKIPTLVYHNRHPLYVNFDFTIEIMKYIIKTTKADIHQSLVTIIDNFFNGLSDIDKLENFRTEYFHASLNKRIDTLLTDITGFTNNLICNFMITSKNLLYENDNLQNIDIILPMSIPFEDYFNNSGGLLYTVLPSIDSDEFITGSSLVTDWSGLTGGEVDMEMITAPIKLDDVVVGEYKLFNNKRKDIEIKLYVNGGVSADGVYNVSTITHDIFDTPKYLPFKYNSPNFSMNKNCIPRLHNIVFV